MATKGSDSGPAHTKAEGAPVKVAITHKGVLEELTALGDLVRKIESTLHSSATQEERYVLDQMHKVVQATIKQVAAIPCPNPMYNILTIDCERLSELY